MRVAVSCHLLAASFDPLAASFLQHILSGALLIFFLCTFLPLNLRSIKVFLSAFFPRQK